MKANASPAVRRRRSPTTTFLSKVDTAIQFLNIKQPALQKASSEVEVEGVRLDLHGQLRLVGLTFGVEPTAATLGWAVTEEMTVVRGGQLVPLSGLALHFVGLSRFEVAFEQDPPGQLDYFELRRDPDLTLRFFFEGGTVRLTAEECRAELVLAGDDEEDSSDPPASASGLVQ